MFISNFPKIANLLLKDLPKNDYPVLNTFLFVSCWLGLIMDQSLTGMTDLITRLNNKNIKVDISTFSKASKKRSDEIFQKILKKAMIELQKKKGKSKNQILFPLDSTIITLTSKLLWKRGYHQVKLFCGLNNWTSGVEGILINFGQGNDNKYGSHTLLFYS